MKNVFIIGSKGIPAQYGGFETFVEELTRNQKNKNIKYHVSCLSDNKEQFYHNGARCFNVMVPNIGSAKAVYYDILALNECIKYIKKNNLNDSIIYILACRIGPFMWYFKKQLQKLNVKVYVNPDGHEWKRAKWSAPIRTYWKLSERLMVKNADLLICDSINIEKYIQDDYKEYHPKTTYISYGADSTPSNLEDSDEQVVKWYQEKNIIFKEYYLIVGRFVPENNYELIIQELLKSTTKKDLVIITNVEKNKFYEELKKKTKFYKDKRIKFVGTVYDQQLLKKIRENAYGYLHGHEVGGTNPSLLEALATTQLNILLGVGFNKEVAKESGIYFSKESGDLAKLLNKIDSMNNEEIARYSSLAKKRIKNHFSWEKIVSEYESLFQEVI